MLAQSLADRVFRRSPARRISVEEIAGWAVLLRERIGNWPRYMKSLSISPRSHWVCRLVLIVCLGASFLAEVDAEQPTIKLLSDEAADACIADMKCMRRLFLEATLGGDQKAGDKPQQLSKWTASAHIAVFTGDRVSLEQRSLIDRTLSQLSLLGRAAGADVAMADTDEVINLIFLMSDDFLRDRDHAFADFLSTVFDGRVEVYDELLSGGSPVCDSRRFLEDGVVSGGVGLAESDMTAQRFEGCISRNMLQMLGLRYPLRRGIDSILNPESNRQTWTSIDFVLLKLLYDPMIKPGMEADRLAAIFPQIYENALRSSS